MSRRFLVTLGLAAGVVSGLALPTAAVRAHPSEVEMLRASAERELCEPDVTNVTNVAEVARVDPVRLGMTESDLVIVALGAHRDPSVDAPEAEARATSMTRPIRWERAADGDLQRVEYESWQQRVYRIRWQLADAFERPVFDEFVRRGEICFGSPEYDQTFEAEPGSAKATLRRVAWRHGERLIELRQLHPLRGGPVYLTVTTVETIREIAAAGSRAFPDPDRSEPWWRRPTEQVRPATDEERETLGGRFARLLSQVDH